jgi:hypothetical protein
MFILADPTTDRASVYGLISPMFSASMILHCLFGGIALATNSTLDSKIFRWRVAVRVGVHDIFGGVHNVLGGFRVAEVLDRNVKLM